MKSIVKDSLILFLITAVAGLLLAIVNQLTMQPIADMQSKAKEEACMKVFADAVSFNEITEIYLNNSIVSVWQDSNPKVSLDAVYEALDQNGTSLGYVFTVTTKEGYGGDIRFSAGITNERVLNGIAILSSNETVGLGLEAEKVLVPQFADKNVDSFVYTKTGKITDNEIDAISSATITTNAFVNGVNACLELFDCISGQGVITVE